MPPRPDIDWTRVKVIKLTGGDEANIISLDLKPCNQPLPKVTIITQLTDPILFQFSLYSFKSLIYPPELINWVIVDPKKHINKISDDPRVRCLQGKSKPFSRTIKDIMEMKWIDAVREQIPPLTEVKEDTPPTLEPSLVVALPSPPPVKPAPRREHFFTILECGDVFYPDALSIKFKALNQFPGIECVIAANLAYYDIMTNTSFVHKMFFQLPRNGLFWKESFWNMKSSEKMVAIPYIGNCISIGRPKIKGYSVKSSVRFFDSLPPEVKELIQEIIKVKEQMKE